MSTADDLDQGYDQRHRLRPLGLVDLLRGIQVRFEVALRVEAIHTSFRGPAAPQGTDRLSPNPSTQNAVMGTLWLIRATARSLSWASIDCSGCSAKVA